MLKALHKHTLGELTLLVYYVFQEHDDENRCLGHEMFQHHSKLGDIFQYLPICL